MDEGVKPDNPPVVNRGHGFIFNANDDGSLFYEPPARIAPSKYADVLPPLLAAMTSLNDVETSIHFDWKAGLVFLEQSFLSAIRLRVSAVN